jgi:5,10-methylenetetrahydromethanopterin reductase
MTRPRFFLHAFPVPTTVAPLAEVAEADGWDGLMLADSQNLVGDPYCELVLAASVTERLELGPFVTNPVTRHPAVTAAAIATVQAESGGRAVLGISRGDSAVSAVGGRRATLDQLAHYLDQVQTYLAGETVEEEGRESRLQWVRDSGQQKVPVDMVATGRRAISVAAVKADRVTFAVGASVERIRWAVGVAREARAAAGLPADTLRAGVCLVAATAPVAEEARELIRANVGIFARFNGQAFGAGGAPDDADREVEHAVAAAYDDTRHGLSGAPQSALPDEFIDRFAVVGPPPQCIRRLAEMAELGLDHVVVIGPSRDVDRRRALAATRRFAAEVLPAIS